MILNPESPAIQETMGQWHKFVAILMLEIGKDEVEITTEMVLKMEVRMKAQDGLNVLVDTRGGRLKLRLVNNREAVDAVREEEARRKREEGARRRREGR